MRRTRLPPWPPACRRLDLGEIQSGLESLSRVSAPHGAGRRKDHVLFVNDSKATNADAAAPALSLSQHLLDRRRPAQGGRHRIAARPISRASPRPI
jgi:hypothetical protein